MSLPTNGMEIMAVVIVGLLLLLLFRSGGRVGGERLERLIRDEGDRSRQQSQAGERALREPRATSVWRPTPAQNNSTSWLVSR